MEVLRERFGFESFRPGQGEVIEHLLAGRSTAAVFPTGGGKSLCYQLPALLLPGVTLVVSPLIALMKDQIDALEGRGIPAARLDSSLSAEQYRKVLEEARSGVLRLLYVAPERFGNERFRGVLEGLRISLFAVDEAHCVSEWGHNFRPDYLKLAGYAKDCGAERTLALTATATPRVLEDICRGFDIDPGCAVRTAFYRPNLTLLSTPVTAEQRDGLLVELLRERPPGATVVYVTLQRTAEEVAERLGREGFEARAYHAGMESSVRAEHQDWFLASESGIIVATIAFGMGIDKPDIRYVYHYNAPKSLEDYSQQIGRAGRDGAESTCQLLLCPDDLNQLENFVYGDTPSAGAVRRLVEELFSGEAALEVDLNALSGRCDIRPLVLRTLLTYLELDGYLEGGTPFYATYRFQPLASSQAILGRFQGERRQFLAGLFRQSKKRRTWFDIDLPEAARALRCDRERLVRALDYLAQEGLLSVKATGLRYRYRRLKAAPEDLAARLSARMAEREQAELGRLAQVVELVGHQGCQVSFLGAHFGEPLSGGCGHCSWCRGEAAAPLGRVCPPFEVGACAGLEDPRDVARFLCGVSSPRLVRAGLTRDPAFGSLDRVPFGEVLARAAREL